MILPIPAAGSSSVPPAGLSFVPPACSSSATSSHSSSLPAHFLLDLYLTEGTLWGISRYAGTTVDWIIKISHLICDSLGSSQVYTHTTGTTSDCYHLERTSSWCQVVPDNELLPRIYEFEPANPITLMKINVRHMHLITSDGHQSSSATFGRHIRTHDERCLMTGDWINVIASHLIPKWMVPMV